MPMCEKKPTTYEDVNDGQFYIINGQLSWSAVTRIIENPEVDDVVKDDYRYWTCDFVWTKNKLQL